MENFREKYHNTTFKHFAAIRSVEAIAQYAKDNNLSVIGDIENLLNNVKSWRFCDLLKAQTNSQGKKFLKPIYHLWTKPTLRKINIFLHVLHKKYDLPKVKCLKAQKERKIDDARTEMKNAQAVYFAAMEKYRSEKGDYFKDLVTDPTAFSDFDNPPKKEHVCPQF